MFPGHNEENMKKTLINAGLLNEKHSSKIICIFKKQKKMMLKMILILVTFQLTVVIHEEGNHI